MPFAQVNGIRIHYQEIGNGPPLTILGGLGDNIRNWSMLAAQMAKHFQILLIDNRGAGQSDKPPGPYKIQDMAHDTVALLERLGRAKTHLLGFSMGAKIAMWVAVHRPELVDKLVLVAPTPASEKSPAPLSDEIHDVLENHEASEAHYKRQFEILFSPRYKNKFTPEMFAKFKMSDPHPQPEAAFQAQYAAVKNFDIAGEVHHIVSPTLLIAGKADRLTSYKNAQWLRDNIPQAKLLLYDEAGHIPQTEETQRFITDVTGFLKDDKNHAHSS